MNEKNIFSELKLLFLYRCKEVASHRKKSVSHIKLWESGKRIIRESIAFYFIWLRRRWWC